jgi:hypothetical protein
MEATPNNVHILKRFDTQLTKNIKRLLGTSHGLNGLPINIGTVCCLVLLAEREEELESNPCEPLERYTHETLFKDAADVGIRANDYSSTALQELTDRGYAEISDCDHFVAKEPALNMAQLLTHLFPKMPGTSFLAYVGQAFDEVATGRTSLQEATERFDQTLILHGVSPGARNKTAGSNRKNPSTGVVASPRSAPLPSVGSNQMGEKLRREELRMKLMARAEEDRTRRGEAVMLEPRADSSVGPVSKGPTQISPKAEIRTAQPPLISEQEQTTSVSNPAEARTPESAEMLNTRTTEDATIRESIKETKPIQDNDESRQTSPIRDMVTERDINMPDVSVPVATEIRGQRIEAERDPGDERNLNEDAISQRVSAFEQKLSLVCPLCKERELTQKTTSTGKTFYVCPDSICGFISWGKPHHVECTRCKNLFMIETTTASGATILKCPRATCRYQRALTSQKRLVRRRVVRR